MSAVLSEPPPQIRLMTEDDLAGVFAIERLVYSFPWSEGIFRDCLRVGYTCLTMEFADEVVGYGIMSIGAGECHLLNVSVDPEFQQQGLGTRIVERMLELAQRHRARMAFLEVRESNQTAYRLYLRLGFNEIGQRKDYYPTADGRENALLLARVL